MSSLEVSKPRVIGNHFGVDVRQGFFNATDKVMKYITFTYVPFNPVGDQVECQSDGHIVASAKLTGPIKPNNSYYDNTLVDWENLWYNSTITDVVLTKVHIEYMDGSEETINSTDLADMNEEGSAYLDASKKAEEEEERLWREEAEKERLEEEIWEREQEEKERREQEEKERREQEEKERAKDKAIKERKNSLKQAYYCFMVFNCLNKVKDDEEMKFHVNQGLWLFIFEVIGVICGSVVPIIGSLIFMMLLFTTIFLSYKCIQCITKDIRFEIPIVSKIKLIK